MIRLIVRNVILSFLALLFSGCSGYDRVLFATKTNVGLDIDNKPPTAELTIARRELAIQPTFSDYESSHSGLPLLGAFGLAGSFFNPGITGHFAGGDAAVYLARKPKGDLQNPEGDGQNQKDEKQVNSALCLSKKPEDSRGFLVKFWHWLTRQDYQKIKHEPRPFYFATDTSYGLKVAWSGTAGPYPDSLKMGYNRKEFASPPVFVEDVKGPCPEAEGNQEGFQVKIPSFYASIDNAGGYTTLQESGITHVQFFATGQAATEFAKREEVQEVAFQHMAPEAARLRSKRIGLHEALITEIVREFNKADNNKKSDILEKAKEEQLIPQTVTDKNFAQELAKLKTSLDPGVAGGLNEVRRIAVASPG